MITQRPSLMNLIISTPRALAPAARW